MDTAFRTKTHRRRKEHWTFCFSHARKLRTEIDVLKFVGFNEARAASQTPAVSHMPPPANLLRLSFDTYEEARAYWRNNANMSKQIWLWHESLGNHHQPFQLPG